MFIIEKNRILNLDHISEIYIRSGGGGYVVHAEYETSIRSNQNLYQGNEEQCEKFIELLGDHLSNPDNIAIHMDLLIP